MTVANYVDTLLKKYRQAPGFPFEDWTRDPVQFYALVNIWDELFRVAAGNHSVDYMAGNDVVMDIDSLIYDVRKNDRTRRVAVYPEKEGGSFAILTSRGDGDYWPDRTELSLPTDLDRDRLCAAFEMIYRYVRADLNDFSSAEDLQAEFIRKYRHLFGFRDYNPFENYDALGRYASSPDVDD